MFDPIQLNLNQFWEFVLNLHLMRFFSADRAFYIIIQTLFLYCTKYIVNSLNVGVSCMKYIFYTKQFLIFLNILFEWLS